MAAGGGGAWKVAYADFVTGMMAFFMVMWIVAQDEKTKGELASYFRNRMMSTVKNSLGVLPQKTSESDGAQNRSKLFENQSAVPLEFMQRLDERLERAVMENPEWKDTKSVKVERSSEGLLITFFDSPGKPLFQPGARGMTEFGQLVFETVGWELARYPQVELELNGHTSGEARGGWRCLGIVGEPGQLGPPIAAFLRRETLANPQDFGHGQRTTAAGSPS